MSLLYADTSALARAYLGDELDHGSLRRLLLEGDAQVVTSELSRLELASAVRSAERAGRVPNASGLLSRIGTDLSVGGSIQLLKLRPENAFASAYRLLLRFPLRTLDAIHLAVAIEDAPAVAGGAEIVLITRDVDQAAAARSLGLMVR